MKLIRLLIVLGLIGGAGAMGLRAYSLREDQLKFEHALAQARQSFLEVTPTVRAMPQDERYRQEFAAALKTYFAELTDARNRFPSQRAGKAAPKSAEAQKAKQNTEDWAQLTRDVFEQLRAGYEPALTATAGGLRLDLVSAKRSTEGGKPTLQTVWALWGAPRYRQDEERAGGVRARQIVAPTSLRGLSFRFIDGDGKFKASMAVSGEPALKVDYPERFETDFPPMALLGTYSFSAFPRDAAKVEITADASLRTPTGTDETVTFSISAPIPEAWKLGPNDTWEGERQEITEEEMDPAGVLKKKEKAAVAHRKAVSWGSR